jgi:hypothetical protein
MGVPGSIVRPWHAGALTIALASAACTPDEPGAVPAPPAPSVRAHDPLAEPMERFETDEEEQRYLLGRARTSIEAGRRDEARVTLQTLSATSRRSEARAHGVLLLASLEVEDGTVDAAVDRLLQLRLEAPAHAAIEFALGNALHAAGRLIEAEGAYRRSIRIRPGFLPAWGSLAKLLETTGRTEDAQELAVRLERQIVQMHHRLRAEESERERALLIEDLARWIPDERVSRALVHGLQDDVFELRLLAALALRETGTESALPALRSFAATLEEPAALAVVHDAIDTIERRSPGLPPQRRRARGSEAD